MRRAHMSAALVTLISLQSALASVRPPPMDVHKGPASAGLYKGPNSYQSKCELHWRNTTLDHFGWVRLPYTLVRALIWPGCLVTLSPSAGGSRGRQGDVQAALLRVQARLEA